MAAPNRITREILAATSVAAGSTEAAPGLTGAWVSVDDLNGGLLAAYVTNGGAAPGQVGQFIWQASDKNDNTNIVELWRGGGSTTANNSPPIPFIDLPKEFKYVRMVCFGNTTAAVTFRGVLFGKG